MADRESIFRTAYLEAPSVQNPNGVVPKQHVRNGHDLELPGFFDTVRTLDQVVDVDYYLPGCPPTPKLIAAAVQTLLSGQLPEKGAVLAPDKALCDECPRKDSKPEKLSLTELKRPHEIIADETKCLMAQGIVCMGPSTRAGCGAQCVSGNMPCTGCFGPTSRVRDKGAKALAGLASIIEPKEEEGIDALWAQLPDPIGTFYRYSLPGSLLRRKKLEPAASGPNTPVTR
jgi:F420-non-reducing hydrogenase small subunit